MKTTFLTGFLLMCACTLAAQSQPNTKTISVEVTNSWSKDKSDAPVVLKIKDLQPGFRVRSAVVMNGSEEIPSQLDDLNGDLKADELAFVMDIPAQSKKTLAITLSSAQADKTYPARVFAEMLIRDAKKQKHAPTQSVTVPGTTNFYNMLHGHGPMFESELVAYRVYFNQKQTVDPYGKFKKGLEIKETACTRFRRRCTDGWQQLRCRRPERLERNEGHPHRTDSFPHRKHSCLRPYTYHSRCSRKRLELSGKRIEHDQPLYPLCRTP